MVSDSEAFEIIMDHEIRLARPCKVHAKDPTTALAMLRRFGQYQVQKAARSVSARVAAVIGQS